jgi:hypothetical protein
MKQKKYPTKEEVSKLLAATEPDVHTRGGKTAFLDDNAEAIETVLEKHTYAWVANRFKRVKVDIAVSTIAGWRKKRRKKMNAATAAESGAAKTPLPLPPTKLPRAKNPLA